MALLLFSQQLAQNDTLEVLTVTDLSNAVAIRTETNLNGAAAILKVSNLSGTLATLAMKESEVE